MLTPRAGHVGDAATAPARFGDVFISYASEDRDVADQVAAFLQSRGWSVWWDRRLLAGAAFDEAIEQALASARCAVVLWSRAAVASHWVRSEASEAVRRDIMVPVLIDRTEVPLEFRRYQHLNLTRWRGALPASALEPLHDAVAHVTDGRGSTRAASIFPRTGAWPHSLVQTTGLIAAATGLFLLFVGFSSSRVYQRAVGISGKFDHETPLTWLGAGVSALVLPSVYVLVFWLTVTMFVTVVHWAGRRVPAVAEFSRRLAIAFDETPLDTLVLRALSLAVGMLAVLVYAFRRQIRAIQGVAYLSDPSELVVLSPAHVAEHFAYRACFGLLVLFCVGAIVIGVRRSLLTREPVAWSRVFAGVALTGAAVFLWAMPHRLLWQEKHATVLFRNEPCYDVGPEGRELLLFCPLRRLPRTLVVRSDDPSLDRSDSHSQNVFSPFDMPARR